MKYIKKAYWGLFVIWVICAAAYFPILENKLMTGWDDQWQVVNQFTEAGFTWTNLADVFLYPYYMQYSPLNQISYTALYMINGYDPVVFHVYCWLLHMMNTVLVYKIIRVLLSRTGLSVDSTCWTTFLTALMFAVHPVQVESVAWVSASKILSCTFFYLVATLFFIDYLVENHNKIRNYLLCLLFYICAYGCKEQAVVFPLWLLFVSKCMGFSFRNVRNVVFPFFFLTIIFGLYFIFGISSFSKVANISEISYTWWQRLFFACYAIPEYVLKWFLPYRLQHLYFFPIQMGEPLPVWLFAYPVLLTVVLWSIWKWLRHRAVYSGGIFFLIHIILVVHIIPMNRCVIVADRYSYLASAGLSFILAYGIVRLYCRIKVKFRILLLLGVAGFILYLGVYTNVRSRKWYSTETLKSEINSFFY